MAFQKAERKRSYIKIALTGPSGSGKTFSALKLAFGLGSKIALLDTENGSGSLYAHLGEYDAQEITAPFSVQKYVDAIREAVAAEYDVLILDSLSHAWAGAGGLLEKKEALDARGGNKFSNWGSITKEHEALKSEILQSRLHIIATMRSKQEHVQERDEKTGQTVVKKVGMGVVQREGMEYEFTTVFDISMDHTAIASKDRTGLFDGKTSRLSDQDGKTLRAWLDSGVPALPTAPEPQAEPEKKAEEPPLHTQALDLLESMGAPRDVEFAAGVVELLLGKRPERWTKGDWRSILNAEPARLSLAIDTVRDTPVPAPA